MLTDLSLCNESLPEQKVKQILLRNDILLTTPSLGMLPLIILPTTRVSVTLRSTQADSHVLYLTLNRI